MFMADDNGKNILPDPGDELYARVSSLLNQWVDLLRQLELKEKSLHQEVSKAVDQEKMKQVLDQIKK